MINRPPVGPPGPGHRQVSMTSIPTKDAAGKTQVGTSEKIMACVFCNSWAGRALSDGPVCEDCYQVAKAVAGEERKGVLLERLQKIHGMLLAQPETPYLAAWKLDLGRRISFMLSGTDVVEVAAKEVAALSTKPKPRGPLKISKFR